MKNNKKLFGTAYAKFLMSINLEGEQSWDI